MTIEFLTGELPEPERSRPFAVEVVDPASTGGPLERVLIVAKLPVERDQEILLGHTGRQFVRAGEGRLAVIELKKTLDVSIPQPPAPRRAAFGAVPLPPSLGDTR